MILTEEEYLAHYGILRKSGRYPWGSGPNKTQRSKTFLDTIKGHEQEGYTQTQIAEMYDDPPLYPFTTTTLRRLKTIARNEVRQQELNQIIRLKEKRIVKSRYC